MAEAELFIKYGDLPANVGTLEATSRLDRALKLGEVEMGLDDTPIGLEHVGRVIGAELVGNVVPPTPARVVEVAYPLVRDRNDITIVKKVTFMESVLRGAMGRTLR